jgi:hypothetical protein
VAVATLAEPGGLVADDAARRVEPVSAAAADDPETETAGPAAELMAPAAF